MLSESKHTPRDINNTQNGKTNYLGRQKQTEAYIKSTIWRFGTFTFKGFSDFVTGERSEELSWNKFFLWLSNIFSDQLKNCISANPLLKSVPSYFKITNIFLMKIDREGIFCGSWKMSWRIWRLAENSPHKRGFNSKLGWTKVFMFVSVFLNPYEICSWLQNLHWQFPTNPLICYKSMRNWGHAARVRKPMDCGRWKSQLPQNVKPDII